MSEGRFAGVDWASEEHAVCVVEVCAAVTASLSLRISLRISLRSIRVTRRIGGR
jgi:hypothetical protein